MAADGIAGAVFLNSIFGFMNRSGESFVRGTKMLGESRKLHLGCGLNTPEGWIHVDGSWNAWMAKYPTLRRVFKVIRFLPADLKDIAWNPDIIIHDLRKPLPFPNDHFTAIYASHLLEHLYLNEAKALLKEGVRVLIPGGILRMVVPDLRSILAEYMGGRPSGEGSENREANHRADRLNERLMFRSCKPRSGNIFLRIYSSLKDLHSHKWMYDAESLIFYFQEAGLVNVREMEYLRSQIEGIEKIEKAESILNGEGICVEGRKAG
jgi:predicted SAM-dependent methyltransferase